MKSGPILSLFVLCSSLWLAPVFGQTKPEAPKPGATPKTAADAASPQNSMAFYFFQLHHIDARHILPAVEGILGGPSGKSTKGPRVAVDTLGNGLILRADEETKNAVKDLIAHLDKPEAPSEPRLRMVHLNYANPNDVLKATEKLNIGGIVASYANERSKTLFVKATDEGVERVKSLVERLDVAAPAQRPEPDVALRIVWLVDKSLAGPEAPPVPNEWSGKIERLRKQIGFGELRLATQVVVSFSPADGAIFESSATAKLKETYVLRVLGALTQKEQGELHLDLTAKAEGAQKQICGLSTTCSGALHGQPLILGMTTINSQPSVFVIQSVPN